MTHLQAGDFPRILLVMDHLRGGGAEMVGLRLAESLVGLGARVTLAQIAPGKMMEIPAGVEYEFWDIPQAKLRAAPAKRVLDVDAHLARLERTGGAFDLVILSWGDDCHALANQFSADKTWLWLHVHMDDREFPRAWRPWRADWWRMRLRAGKFRKKLPRRKQIYHLRSGVGVSAGVISSTEAAFGVSFARRKMIHNPLDIQKLRQAAQGPCPAPGPAVVWVGRFTDQKQPLHAIEAFAANGLDGHLWMIGDGPLLEKTKRLVKAKGLEARVHFPGFVSDAPRWIAHSQGLFLTSGFEGFGVVLSEALALGKPCVSYDCPCGPSEILRGPLAAGLVPPNDIPAMARALRRMVEAPILPTPEERNRFDAAQIAREFLALAGEVLKTPTPALKLAVIIPTYNRRELVVETLASIRAQTTMPWCVVIVDDGSTDGTVEAVERWLASHAMGCEVKVVRQTNAGVSAARNTGAAAADGADLLAFLDSDDLWPVDFAEHALRAFSENPSIVAATSDRLDVEYGPGWKTEKVFPWPIANRGATRTIRKKVFTYPCSTVFRAGAFARAGGYQMGLHYGEDLILALVVSSFGPWGRIESLPVIRRQFLKGATRCVTHLSACRDADVLRSFALLLESQADAHGCGHSLRSVITHRWRRAGRAMAEAGRVREARCCYKRAIRRDGWDLKARFKAFVLRLGR